MLCLHAAFHDRQFFLWSESAVVAAPNKSARFPYAAAAADFPKADLLGFRAKRDAFRDMLLWSPTRGGEAMASSPLIAPEPTRRSKLQIQPWQVTALPLTPAQSVDLFLQLAGKHVLVPGVVAAPDLAFAALMLRLAGSIVATQHYLPGLRDEKEGWAARWLPVLGGELSERLNRAAEHMPASLRALTEEGQEAAPNQPARDILAGMLTHWVDFLVRSEDRTPKRKSFPSIHDRWLYALRSADAVMATPDGGDTELAARIDDWRRPLALAANSPLRLCFRLEEPEVPESADPGLFDKWFVRYFLQPHEDQSLLIEAAIIWAGRDLPRLKQEVRFRETLLSFLGQAAGICAQVSASLESKAPDGYELTNEGVLEFLTRKAALLRQFGFSVLLPSWWTGKGARARLSVKAKAIAPPFKARSGLDLNTLIQFRPELALDGEPLSARELELLSKIKASLVRLRGQWVEIGGDQIRKALAFLKKQGARSLTLGELIRLKIGASQLEEGLPLDDIEAEGWLDDLLKKLDRRSEMEPCPQPEQFAGSLRPYQTRGFSWLAFLSQWGLGACLADDMGLGKTVQTLALLQRDSEAGNTGPVLLVCPVSVVDNWRKEAAKFTPSLRVHVHHGGDRLAGKAFRDAVTSAGLTLTSYGLLHRDLRTMRTISWRGVILDEAQNIKNASTKQAAAAFALQTQYRLALTGTPVENNVGDLWSIMEFLNPGLLGNQASFRRHFFLPIQNRGDEDATQRLKQITGPFVLRRLKTDKTIIEDLPEKMEVKTYCPLTREQTTLYAAVLADLQAKMEAAEGIERRGLILALLTALKQVCNHPAQFLADGSSHGRRSGKLVRLEEILEEIVAARESALLFTQYAEMGHILQQRLQDVFGREMPFFHGGIPKPKRDKMIARFQQGGEELPLLILSLKAGGTGLNLTRANHVIHFDRWWNPAVEDQATDRAFRIGQKRNVTVHKFVCSGTVEDKIDEMIENKKKIAGSVVGTGEAWLTELSNQELRRAFALTAVPMED